MNIMLKNIKNLANELNASIADNTEIILEKGEYHIYPDDLTQREFMITNSLPRYEIEKYGASYVKDIAVICEGRKNITVDGGGSKIVCHGKMIPFYAYDSENVAVKNLTVDYADPTVFESKVLEVGERHYILEVHPDTKYVIEKGKIRYYGENFKHYANKVHNFVRLNPETNDIIRLYPSPFSDPDCRYEQLDGRKVRLYPAVEGDNPYKLTAGEIMQERDGVRDACGILFDNCKNVLLEDVNMQFMHGLGIVTQRCDTVTVNRVRVAPDENSGRTCAAFADCCQISNCRGKVSVTNCYFSAAHDDAINVHGTFLAVEKSEGNEVILKYIQPDTTGFNIFKVGDTVEVVDPRFMLPEGTATVTESELLDELHIRIRLNRPAEDFKEGFSVENISAAPEVYISGCEVFRIPTRGFLVSTRGKVVIENNRFNGLIMPAVLMANDAAVWYETGPVHDVTIRNNLIINQSCMPIFQLLPENREHREGEFVHKNITIENNRAECEGEFAWLWAKSTDNIVFRGNTANREPLPNKFENCGRITAE